MAIRRGLVALIFLYVSNASADDDVARAIVQSQRYVEHHAILANDATETDLVMLWQELRDIDRMVWLENRKALPPKLQPELHRRLSANQLRVGLTVRMHDDPLVRGLAEVIRLHASIATQHLRGNVSESAYADVMAFASGHGRELARHVEKRYAKGKKLLRDSSNDKAW